VEVAECPEKPRGMIDVRTVAANVSIRRMGHANRYIVSVSNRY